MTNPSNVPLATGQPSRRALLRGAGGLVGLGVAGAGWRVAAAQETATPAAGATRPITHALGTTNVPTRFDNFIILDSANTLGYSMSLGMVPTHASEPGGRTPPFAPILYDAYPETATIAPLPEAEVDLEEIVRIAPDLIIAWADYIVDVYDQLSQIAPTVGFDYQYQDPWAEIAQVAAALSVPPERVAELQADIDRIIEDARPRVEGAGGTISFATLNADGTFDVYKSEPPFFVTLGAVARLGFEITPNHAALGVGAIDEARIDDVSAERFAALSGDYLVLFQATTSEEDRQALRDGQQSALYQSLPAVRGGRVLVADRLAAYGSAGVAGWLAQIEEFVGFLSGETNGG